MDGVQANGTNTAQCHATGCGGGKCMVLGECVSLKARYPCMLLKGNLRL